MLAMSVNNLPDSACMFCCFATNPNACFELLPERPARFLHTAAVSNSACQP